MKLQSKDGVIKDIPRNLVADYKAAGWKKVIEKIPNDSSINKENDESHENKGNKITKLNKDNKDE